MKTKICTSCKDDKDLKEFNKNKTKKDGLNSICRICSNLRSKKYYAENREEHIKVIRKRTKRIIVENRKKLFNFYKNNPCIDCGEKDPIVLDCDHRKDKTNNVSSLIGGGYSWKVIEQEIAKCDVRCANCHRRKTAIEQNWYKDLK